MESGDVYKRQVLLKPQTPEMLLEEKQFQEQVYATVMKLPEKQAPGFLSPGYSETCAVAFLSEWSALPGGHPYLCLLYTSTARLSK